MVEALAHCSDLLERYGGHKMAAGLSLQACNIDALRERFREHCESQLGGRDLFPSIDLTAWIGLGQVDDALLRGLQQLQPFGTGNPEPVWGARALQVVGQPRVVG